MMEQQQESEEKQASRERSSTSRNHPVGEEGETAGDHGHPHEEKRCCEIEATQDKSSSEANNPKAASEEEQNSGHGNSPVAEIPLPKSVSEGFSRSREEQENISSLQEEIGSLKIEESMLDMLISEMQGRLRNLRKNENSQRWLYFTEEDILSLPCIQKKTLIVIKAPQGTSIQVPRPYEHENVRKRRCMLILRSNKGAINIWLISPLEKYLGIKIPDGGSQPRIPETSRENENAPVSPKTEEIRERIGAADPSPQRYWWIKLNTTTDDVSHEQEGLNNALEDADFYVPTRFIKLPLYGLQNANGGCMPPPDRNLSIEAITDLFAAEENDFNFLSGIHVDALLDFRRPSVQPPPSSTAMPSISEMLAEIEWDCWNSRCDDCTTASTCTSQEQITPPISTATPSVSNMKADIDRYILEMIEKDNAISNTNVLQGQTPTPGSTAMHSIIDTTADISWGSMKMIHNDSVTSSINTAQAQAQAQPRPPMDTPMPFTDIGWNRLKMIHEDNVTASINASQAQTPPKFNTAMPSVAKTLPDMNWESMDTTHEDNGMANITASHAQTPPRNSAMPVFSNMIANTDKDSLNIIHENNTMTSTNTTQAQSTQPRATAMSSAAKTTGSNNESITQSMEEVSPNSETAKIAQVAREIGQITKTYRRRAKRETADRTACRKKE
ncbi:hypothetical protein F511_23066 [Dorcoceras hygrometricum]|uniref:E2F transcription factor CC-MB domain-containing protein n=1 Tax=Dorcoceras hygrometricum TaxID=472368 RepID=A0A2Z7A966_9LAMI|nr:hypothetical protein F511_23066 [Dorcoceras hygrometricum]